MKLSALKPNATTYPACRPTAPRNAPMVRLAQEVVCVMVLAACSSCGVAMPGRMEARPLVKNGDANMSIALSTKSSQSAL